MSSSRYRSYLQRRSLNSSSIWITDSDIRINQMKIHQSSRIGISYAGQEALLP